MVVRMWETLLGTHTTHTDSQEDADMYCQCLLRSESMSVLKAQVFLGLTRRDRVVSFALSLELLPFW